MDDQYTIDTVIDGNQARIHLLGEIDLAAVAAIDAELAGLLREDITAIAVDLSKVTFLDSSGISALLTSLRQATEAGKTFTADGAHGLAARILGLAGVADYLADPAARD